MNNKELFNKLKEISKKLPRFNDGRINYKNANTALVLSCFIQVGNEILLLKRSDKVATYKELWGTVAGYIDEFKTLKEKVLEELKEELNIDKEQLNDFKYGENYEFTDKNNKTWIVYPVLVSLNKKPEIKLNWEWEHLVYQWILPIKIKEFDIVPNIDESLSRILNIE